MKLLKLFKNEKLKKITDYISNIMFYSAIVFLLYLIFMSFSAPLFFKNKVTYKNVAIHYSDNMGNINNVIDKAYTLLKKSEMYSDTLNYKVFVCNSYTKYKMFNPFGSDSTGATQLLSGNIMYPMVDVNNDMAYAERKVYNKRNFSAVLAHEFNHLLSNEKYGFFKTQFLMDRWKQEGYAEYIANSTSFDTNEGLKIFMQGQENKDAGYQYFLYRLRVKYLIDVQHKTFNEIVNTKYDLKKLDEQIRKEIVLVKY